MILSDVFVKICKKSYSFVYNNKAFNLKQQVLWLAEGLDTSINYCIMMLPAIPHRFETDLH